MQRLIKVLRLSRPVFLLLGALNYILGAAISRYLGRPENPTVFWLGLIAILLLQMSMSLLVEIFRPGNEPVLPEETPLDRRLVRDGALYVSTVAITTAMVIVVLLFYNGKLAPPALFFLALVLLLVIIYAMPPLRLFNKGFGELLVAINIAYLGPSVAFLLQYRDYHGLLSVTALPLTLLTLAGLLALDFPSFASDMKYERNTLLTRLGWEIAIPLHHGLVLSAYLLFASGPFLGFAFGLVLPAFYSLPFALLQIYWLRNIALGAKPIWSLLSANAISVLALTSYLLSLTFWLR